MGSGCKVKPSEFYDIAAQQGFYGLERGGLTGKNDNVRKYWEDVIIKLSVRNSVEKLLSKKSDIRVVDLGCGSGEGFELLTHISISKPLSPAKQCFILSPENISSYVGIDISDSMIQQGRANYENLKNVRFEQADLNRGFPLMDEQAFDIYFSSYSSLSHLAPDKLMRLMEEMFSHAQPGAFFVLDLLGRYSLEWPIYWNENRSMLPYNMAYLTPQESRGAVQWFDVCFWSSPMLFQMLDEAAKKAGTSMQIAQCVDRSIFIGRHMETALFGAPCLNYRYHVNSLFDHDLRGEIEHMLLDLGCYAGLEKTHPRIWTHILEYEEKWNCVVSLVDALIHGNDNRVSHLIETSQPDLSNELKFLAWLYRNAHRFPVVDFWASIMGPQIAVILRNIEMSLGPALGCGHGLFCVVEIAPDESTQH